MRSTVSNVNIVSRMSDDDEIRDALVKVTIVNPHSADRACKITVCGADGCFVDATTGGSMYSDGKFFTEGDFDFRTGDGLVQLSVSKGPNYLPVLQTFACVPGMVYEVTVTLRQWFSPEAHGWYSGDNHVHSQHDTVSVRQTGLAFTALQGRANGLSFITEAGSHVSYEGIESLSTSNFILSYAPEVRHGCYAGHLNTPGYAIPFDDQLPRYGRTPLPTQAVTRDVREAGGAVIYTHPLSPAHQVHWMGATEVLSDAVLHRCADLFDIDSVATELLWFTVLNLGNQVGCSSYTDSTLERPHSLTPGDRRIYCKSDVLEYGALVDSMRQSRTVATNGGTVFVLFSVDGEPPGSAFEASLEKTRTARVEVRSLRPLTRISVIRRGIVYQELDTKDADGRVFELNLCEAERAWYVVRAEDVDGNWCITSPIYFDKDRNLSPAVSLILEIANHTRFIHLQPEFYLHTIVTVSEGRGIESVTVKKDGQLWKVISTSDENCIIDGRLPVTELETGLPYSTGWVWHAVHGRQDHFQLDVRVTESGWYSMEIRMTDGTQFCSDSVRFDENNSNSHELSVAHLYGAECEFTLWGYGEEMALVEVPNNKQDRWWYPEKACWKIRSVLEGQAREIYGEHSFHPSVTSPKPSPILQRLFRNTLEIGGHSNSK